MLFVCVTLSLCGCCSPEPVNAGPGAAAAARCPPAPPPRNSQPPFANLLNYSGASAFFNDDLSDTTSESSSLTLGVVKEEETISLNRLPCFITVVANKHSQRSRKRVVWHFSSGVAIFARIRCRCTRFDALENSYAASVFESIGR